MNLVDATYSEDLSGIASYTEAVDGLSDLYVHRTVEMTVDSLTSACRAFSGLSSLGEKIAKHLMTLELVPGRLIDPDDKLQDGLDEVITKLTNALPGLTVKKGSIDRDVRLSSSHCDMLHVSYDQMINAVAQLIESVKELRSSIISHDLDADDSERSTYPSVELLLESIRLT